MYDSFKFLLQQNQLRRPVPTSESHKNMKGEKISRRIILESPFFLLKTHFKGKSGTPKFLGIWRVTTCRVIVRLAFAVWGTTGPLTCAVRCFGDLSARGGAAHLTSIFFTARCIGQRCVLHLASGMSCNHIALSSHGSWTQRQTDEVALERPKSQIFTEQSWCNAAKRPITT